MKLFSPIGIGNIELSNRIAMSPMTRNRAFGGVPNEMMRIYYNQRCSAGLIITEGTNISTQAVGYIDTPGIFTSKQFKHWGRITESVHKYGSKIFLQLWHCGRSSHSDFHDGKLPVAPSAIQGKGRIQTPFGLKDKEIPHSLDISGIKEIIKDYTEAAKNAIEVGFDGVEIHGANGYLVDQFICDGSNKRTDEYGGSIDNRIRFAIELIESISEQIGAEKTAIKLSPNGTFNSMYDSTAIETFSKLISELNNYNLAYLHLAEHYSPVGKHYPLPDDYLQEGEVIKFFRKIYNGIIIGNGGFDKEKAVEYTENGYCDIISFGKPYISNPNLPTLMELDKPLVDWNKETFYGGNEVGFIDYPFI